MKNSLVIDEIIYTPSDQINMILVNDDSNVNNGSKILL